MLTKTQIIELVDAARSQGVADRHVLALVGWADYVSDQLLDPTTTNALISAWDRNDRLGHLTRAKTLGHATRTGIALLAYAVGTDLSWQLTDDMDNPLAVSALLDLVADCACV